MIIEFHDPEAGGIHMLIPPENILTDTPQNNVYQLPGHPLGQSSWNAKSTNTQSQQSFTFRLSVMGVKYTCMCLCHCNLCVLLCVVQHTFLQDTKCMWIFLRWLFGTLFRVAKKFVVENAEREREKENERERRKEGKEGRKEEELGKKATMKFYNV